MTEPVIPPLQIRGGADEYQAALIAAVVQMITEEERAVRSEPERPPTPPAWVRAGWVKHPSDPFPDVHPDPW